MQPGVSRKDATSPHDPPDAGRVLGRVCHGGCRVLRAAHGQFPRAAEFGSQAAMGLSFLYLTVILTLGLLLALLQTAGVSGFPRLARLFAGFGHGRQFLDPLAVDDRRGLPGDCAALALWRAQTVEINSSSLETYDESNPTIQTLRLLENHLSGLLPLEISLKADKPDFSTGPTSIARWSNSSSSLCSKSRCLFARSYLDFFNEINRPFSSQGEIRVRRRPRTRPTKKRDIDRGRLSCAALPTRCVIGSS